MKLTTNNTVIAWTLRNMEPKGRFDDDVKEEVLPSTRCIDGNMYKSRQQHSIKSTTIPSDNVFGGVVDTPQGPPVSLMEQKEIELSRDIECSKKAPIDYGHVVDTPRGPLPMRVVPKEELAKKFISARIEAKVELDDGYDSAAADYGSDYGEMERGVITEEERVVYTSAATYYNDWRLYRYESYFGDAQIVVVTSNKEKRHFIRRNTPRYLRRLLLFIDLDLPELQPKGLKQTVETARVKALSAFAYVKDHCIRERKGRNCRTFVIVEDTGLDMAFWTEKKGHEWPGALIKSLLQSGDCDLVLQQLLTRKDRRAKLSITFSVMELMVTSDGTATWTKPVNFLKEQAGFIAEEVRENKYGKGYGFDFVFIPGRKSGLAYSEIDRTYLRLTQWHPRTRAYSCVVEHLEKLLFCNEAFEKRHESAIKNPLRMVD